MTYNMAVSTFPATTQTHVFTTTVTKATSWLEIHTECVGMMVHGTRKHLFVNVSKHYFVYSHKYIDLLDLN